MRVRVIPEEAGGVIGRDRPAIIVGVGRLDIGAREMSGVPLILVEVAVVGMLAVAC